MFYHTISSSQKINLFAPCINTSFIKQLFKFNIFITIQIFPHKIF